MNNTNQNYNKLEVSNMCAKNGFISNNNKIYLATFEFISGEYGQIFKKVFYSKDIYSLEKEIHYYFVDYYGTGNTSEIDGNVYYYWHGEIAVKYCGAEEIKSYEQLVNNLF